MAAFVACESRNMTPITPPSPVELHLEPPDGAMRIWWDSFKYIAEAAPDSGYELNDIRSALHTGSMQFWTVSKSGALSAVCGTQIKLSILQGTSKNSPFSGVVDLESG